MHLSKGRIYFLLFAAALYFGWQHLSRNANETVVLHIPPTNRSQDTYVNLWVVDDANNVWIRAESPGRLWLEYLREEPVVELLRADRTVKYRALRDDHVSTRDYVDKLFRAKYGLADEVRARLGRQTVPIRLVRP